MNHLSSRWSVAAVRLHVHSKQRHCLRQGCLLIGKRQFSVKELPWCAPKTSPNRKPGLSQPKIENKANEDCSKMKLDDPIPIEEFGIVAAMSENRVIGLNGTIPWPRCAEDRQNFKNLTRDSIMIVGRGTFEEEPNQKHICHARECIVVSKTLTTDQLAKRNVGAPQTMLKVAKSLPQALGLAKQSINSENQSDRIQCWVAGGERLYDEALRHKSAKELHLTTIHVKVDVEEARRKGGSDGIDFAMFPAKHRWDRYFAEIARVEGGGPTEDASDSPSCTYVTYGRKTRS